MKSLGVVAFGVLVAAGIAVADPAAKAKPVPAAPACDFDGNVTKGDGFYGRGLYAGALAAYDNALACKADSMVSGKAALAACKSRKAVEAKKHYANAPASMQPAIEQYCESAKPPIKLK